MTRPGCAEGPAAPAGATAPAASGAPVDLPALPPLPVRDAHAARALIAAIQARLAAAGVTLRRPPPEPDPLSCCGRGCVGCVWSGYYDAVGWWREDALAALSGTAPPAGG